MLRDASVYYDEITGLPTLANVQVEVQRRLFDHSQLGILYVTLDGVHALEQQQGFEVVDEVFRVIGRRLSETRGQPHPQRGLRLRLEPRQRVPRRALARLATAASSTKTICASSSGASKRSCSASSRTRLESELLAHVELYVGYSRLGQSPKVRFRRALLEAIEDATRGIQQERSEIQHRLGAEFERVISESQITCVYQPIVSLGDYRVLGYELLARGPLQQRAPPPRRALRGRPRREPRLRARPALPPGGGARQRDTARQVSALHQHGAHRPLLRARAATIAVQEFIDATPEELRGQTVIEITENTVIDDFAHMRDVVDRLREQGFRIAIDDAGAGYSGLQTMVEIEPDFIKLDMSLTRNLDRSLVKQKLVGTMRDFCQQADIALVAEGIETQAQLDVLLDARHRLRPGLPLRASRLALPAAGDDPSGRCACGDRPRPRRARRRLRQAGATDRLRQRRLHPGLPLVVESRPR